MTPPNAPTPGDFTPQADAYARARPGYPPALIERLIEDARLQPGAAVTDLGAGTGIFTALLSGRGYHITALEPNESMRAKAPSHADVSWRHGTFESTTLDDQSQDWLVAAQAFHWADPSRALPELARILKPARRFTALWNNRDNPASSILQWTMKLIHRIVPNFDDAYRECDWSSVLTTSGHFTDVHTFEERHVVTMTAQRYLDLWRSHNLLTTTAGIERHAALIQQIQQGLSEQNIDAVDVPYLCRAWSAAKQD